MKTNIPNVLNILKVCKPLHWTVMFDYNIIFILFKKACLLLVKLAVDPLKSDETSLGFGGVRVEQATFSSVRSDRLSLPTVTQGMDLVQVEAVLSVRTALSGQTQTEFQEECLTWISWRTFKVLKQVQFEQITHASSQVFFFIACETSAHWTNTFCVAH